MDERAERGGATQEDPEGGGAKDTMRTAAGIHGGPGGELGRDELIAQHPAMNVPSQSEDARIKSDKQGGQDDIQNNSPPPAPGATDAPNQTDGSSSGPGVSKTDAPDTSERAAEITKLLNFTKYDGKSATEAGVSMDDFMPHIMHKAHDPVPIAMVNRHPEGKPCNEGEEKAPQDVAWLSALKNAQQSVFIQSPTLNAAPIIPAIIDACRRGVVVTIYLSLGYNDLGEMIPGQGGTNEQVMHSMYQTLCKEGKQEQLRVHWYVGKDQLKPMGAAAKKRNCHVKFMSVDDQIAILGNGNQDTQSWFHSQEINILVDSSQIVHEWHRGLDSNQNTKRHGLVDNTDGVWRDKDGTAVESSGTKATGMLGGLKGLTGAIARVRGTGGF